MPVRALIIAVEDYPAAIDLPASLPGTSDAGEGFYAWLVEAKGVDPRNIRCATAAGRRGRTAGTTRAEVLGEIVALVREGRDRTEELYVFFSGHGFTYEAGQGRRPVEILLTSNYRSAAESGDACLDLRELSEKLQRALGPGQHVYFVDACRNVLGPDEIEPLGIGKVLGASALGIDGLSTLFSAAPGQRAAAVSPFATLVLAGLYGAGRAKAWERDRMVVRFAQLGAYVRANMPDRAADASVLGASDALVWEVPPPYVSRCTVRVEGAPPGAALAVEVGDARGFAKKSYAITDGVATIDLPPDDYVIAIAGAEAQPVDLYEPREVVFDLSPSAGSPPSVDDAPPPDPLRVRLRAIGDRIAAALGEGPRAPGEPDDDVSRLLAALGARRVEGEGGIVVLAALADAGEIAVGATNEAPAPVAGIEGVAQARFDAGPGPLVVTLSRPRAAALSFVSHALPGWITLVTLVDAVGAAGNDVVVRQYFVPVGSRLSEAEVREMVEAQEAFAARRPVPASRDPRGRLLALYDLRRRGAPLGPELAALAAAQGSLPDLAVLAGREKPGSPPLVMDGVIAIGEDAAGLPLAGTRLVYAGPWTMWRYRSRPTPNA
jgi:hypothetical protein